jgi:hypothetical protein
VTGPAERRRDPQNDDDLAKETLSRVILGEVAVLVNERKPAGTYQVEFDGAGLSSGVYFYHLNADGNIQTKKMILEK